ncbi:MAG: glycosyltransferase family 4 protein [Acidobacteriia bacterium]|nr:glycosyltransferase family 4 protein [Terriglobia bacterium]MBV8907080.1 glycosyltransferase family 4 protein [Terriglobia bacterium]
MKVAIVAENASTEMGGEAFLPYHYFRLLRERKLDVHLVVHARNARVLRRDFGGDWDRLHFVSDTWVHKALFWLGLRLPRRVAEATTGFLLHLATQMVQRRIVRGLVRDEGIGIVHEPIPVSPKMPSLMFGLGAAVIIGPLNGGMEYPEAFRGEQSFFVRLAVAAGRRLANLANRLLPGKLMAAVILVANCRTREALPAGVRGKVLELPENGVNLALWRESSRPQNTNQQPKSKNARFVYVGRLVDWKALDIALAAIALVGDPSLLLDVIGDGPMRPAWERLSSELGLESQVSFHGWMSQPACAARLSGATAFVLPSLFECGGAVVLEAMAMRLPVIATAWGGPSEYLDGSCGILIPPESRDSLIRGFAAAMKTLAESPGLAARLGEAGYSRARDSFDWDRKIDRILEIYQWAASPQVNSHPVPQHASSY